MRMDSKGPVRLVMPNGTFDISDVRRVVIGKITDPNKDFPALYFRSIRIETEDGAIEILMEAVSPRSLQMEHGTSVFQSMKKAIAG